MEDQSSLQGLALHLKVDNRIERVWHETLTLSL